LRVHDARSCWLSSALPRFAPSAGLGVLACLVPPGLAWEVLGAARAEAAQAAGPAAPARRLRLLPPLLGRWWPSSRAVWRSGRGPGGRRC